MQSSTHTCVCAHEDYMDAHAYSVCVLFVCAPQHRNLNLILQFTCVLNCICSFFCTIICGVILMAYNIPPKLRLKMEHLEHSFDDNLGL